MPTYIIDGKKYFSEQPLSPEELEELAASVSGPTTPATEEPKKKGWGDWGIEMGLSTIPSVAGNIAGTALAPVTGGLSYPILSALGGGVGEGLRQLYTGDFNPGLLAVESGMNIFPGVGKLGKGAMGAIKYGAKQGAIQGAIGSVPRHIAETGKLELPGLEEAGAQTAFGGLFGGALGGGYHVGQQLLGGPAPTPDVKPPAPAVEPPAAPVKPKLRMVGPGQYIDTATGQSWVPPAAAQPAAAAAPQGPEIIAKPNWTLPERRKMEQEGWVIISPDKNGNPRMMRIRGALGPGEVEAGKTVPISTPRVNDELLANMERQGYRITSTDPTTTIFTLKEGVDIEKNVEVPEFPERMGDVLPFKPGDMGRPGPNEQTGRVAQFVDPKFTRFVSALRSRNDAELHNMLDEAEHTIEVLPDGPDRRSWDMERKAIIEELNQRPILGPDPMPEGWTPERPEEMRVPGTRKGGGLENIAIGPKMEDTSVLDVMGHNLYGENAEQVITRELIQNVIDEKRISGNTGPTRIHFFEHTAHPITDEPAYSITVQDSGRGLDDNDLYSIFTDVGKSGKRHVANAAGGFGFAKAAPLLGGDYVKVQSITIDPETGDKVKYTFEGNPNQLKNQQKGVPLRDELVDPDTPTGMTVEVFFAKEQEGGINLLDAYHKAKTIIERTPGMENVQILRNYLSNPDYPDEFLQTGKVSTVAMDPVDVKGNPLPTRQGRFSTVGAEVDMHYDLDNLERTKGTIIYMNNGMYAFERSIDYGNRPAPHLPKEIVVDIRANVNDESKQYPFELNRSDVKDDVEKDVKAQIKKIRDEAEIKRQVELEKVFNELQPNVGLGNRHVIHDSGNRYLPAERARLVASPLIRKVANLMESMLTRLDTLFPVGTEDGQIGRTAKFGFIINDPKNGGLNVPNPNPGPSDKRYAVLINPLSLMANWARNPVEAAEMIAHAILHEFTHNIVRPEAHLPAKLIRVDARFGTGERSEIVKAILGIITGPDGEYAPGIQELLRDYKAARGRIDTTLDPLSRSTEGEHIRTEGQAGVLGDNRVFGEGITDRGGPVEYGEFPEQMSLEDEAELQEARSLVDRARTGIRNFFTNPASTRQKHVPSTFEKIIGFPTQMTTTGDFSGVFRQALPMMLSPEFRGALIPMFKAFASPEFATRMEMELHRLPTQKHPIDPVTGKRLPSVADKARLKLIEGTDVSSSEHGLAAPWVEEGIPGIPGRGLYKATAGKYFKASNRAYATLLNYMRAHAFQRMMDDSQRIAIQGATTGEVRPGFLKKTVTPEESIELNGYQNIVLSRAIADYVNTATGRGPLRFHAIPVQGTEINLEPMARILSHTMFSPRLFASHARMLNPNTYMMAPPQVRKEYLKSALAVGSAWMTFLTLGKMAGAEIEDEPTSADFGKARFGNLRMDPAGGFQQYLVAMARAASGGWTSSATGEYHPFGSGFRSETAKDMQERFFVNKLNPMTKFAYDVANASEYVPMHVGDRTLQMFAPLILQDLYTLANEEPDLIGTIFPTMFGMASQIYEQGETSGKLISTESEPFMYQGSGIREMWDQNIPEESIYPNMWQ